MKKTLIAILITALFSPGAFANDYKAHEHASATAISVGTPRVIHVITESISGKTRYSPSVYIVKVGEKVNFKIFNATDKVHGFSIDAFNVKGNLVINDNTIEFSADKEGLYEVYCQYHPAHLNAQLLVVK